MTKYRILRRLTLTPSSSLHPAYYRSSPSV